MTLCSIMHKLLCLLNHHIIHACSIRFIVNMHDCVTSSCSLISRPSHVFQRCTCEIAWIQGYSSCITLFSNAIIIVIHGLYIIYRNFYSLLLSDAKLLCAYHHVHLLHAVCPWRNSAKVSLVEEVCHYASDGKNIQICQCQNQARGRTKLMKKEKRAFL